MSEAGFSITDLNQLRRVGMLLDSVLVGAGHGASAKFRTACDQLSSVIDAAVANPPKDLQSLILSELIGHHFGVARRSCSDLLDDLRMYEINADTRSALEALAQAIDRDKATATARMQSMRY